MALNQFFLLIYLLTYIGSVLLWLSSRVTTVPAVLVSSQQKRRQPAMNSQKVHSSSCLLQLLWQLMVIACCVSHSKYFPAERFVVMHLSAVTLTYLILFYL